MLPASAEYIAFESQPRGITPVVRATFLPFLWPTGISPVGSFLSAYPPEQNDTYVKTTTYFDETFYPHYATDPVKGLTGTPVSQSWVSESGVITNQRFHIDLGITKIINRIYYENYHESGYNTEGGVKNFTIWGSNNPASFADLTYGNDSGWTELTPSSSFFEEHCAVNVAYPKYITVANSNSYRYYAIKFANNYGNLIAMGVRRIELQEAFPIYNECAYIAPDRIQADYHGFSGGYWISPVIASNIEVTSSPFVFTWDWNSPGFDLVVSWRSAEDTTALVAASWVQVNQGDTLNMLAYYQFKVTCEGYRAWAVDSPTDTELLINPGFELPPGGEWAAWYFATIDLQSTERVDEGVYSAKVEVPAAFGEYDGLYQYNGELAFGDKARLTARVYWEAGCAPMLSGVNFQGGGIVNYDQQTVHIRRGEWQDLVLDYVHAGEDTTLILAFLGSVIGEASVFHVDACSLKRDVGSIPDTWTAYAVDDLSDPDSGYACDAQVPGDLLTYIENLQLLGEFTLMRDIEQAGSVSMEVPVDFSDLVAGSHSGLVLNNRQGSFVGGVWVPAPAYSPNMPSFFLSGQSWYGIQLKIELGWLKGGWFRSGFIEDEWMKESYTDFITLFYGKVKKWGPITRAVDADGKAQPNTVEIYAEDWVLDCLNKRIALPLSDGTPNPKIYGEFLCEATEVSGWSPSPIVRSAYFETDDENEVDGVVEAGGGVTSRITPGLTGNRAARAQTSGANQSAYRLITMPNGEIFVTGSVRFTSIPAVPGDFPLSHLNMSFLQIINDIGTVDYDISVGNTGLIFSNGSGGESKFNILAYENVPLTFALLISPTNPGYRKLWINGEEILTWSGDLSAYNPIGIRFGAITQSVSETWVIDFDDIDLRAKYYHGAYKIEGAPFADIGPVYKDNVAIQNTQVVPGPYTETLTRYPAWGMVQITSDDPDYKPSGTIMARVVEHSGGRHPLEVIELLIVEAGLTEFIDSIALAAAYVTCPNDIIHARFEGGGGSDRLGLKDVSSFGMTIADALKEICSRCLYWIFTDAGKIKIIPYIGLMPTATPVLDFVASNKWENTQTFDLDSISDFITATYGWYERNPGLFYISGSQVAGGQGMGLDYTWQSPVATESREMVKAKADLLLQFLSAQERIDPVRTSLLGARIEGMDVVSLVDPLLHEGSVKYWVIGKEVGLDQGSRETTLQLIRYLGDN